MPVANINTVTLTGNLTRDPELRTTGGGTSVCELRLACNSLIKRGDKWESKPNYFQITAWAGMGENAAKHLSKGSAVAISGRLEWQQWDAAEEGKKNSRVVIIAERLQYLDKRGAPKQNDDGSDSDIPF